MLDRVTCNHCEKVLAEVTDEGLCIKCTRCKEITVVSFSDLLAYLEAWVKEQKPDKPVAPLPTRIIGRGR